MPQQAPLRPGDPSRVGRYRLGGRIESVPSDDPIFIGLTPEGTEVAVSVLRGDWTADAAARDRFAAEAAVARRVPPFCAARVLDAGVDPAGPYLVSDYVAGPSLLEEVRGRGVLHGHDLEAAAIGMATGLASVHQAGLVHGRFGPECVIMAPDGSPRVVEYGITPPYGLATPSADMLAWAQTVVFAASGRPAAVLDDLQVLPHDLRGPVERCLDPDPAARPAARSVVLSLLGEPAPPAGLLAAGSRRAARPGGRRGPQPADVRPPAGRTASGSHAVHRDAPGGLHQRARLGGRRRIALCAAAALMAALAVAAVVHVLTSGGGHPAAGPAAARSGSPLSSTQSPSPTPSAGPVTPAGFAGSWSGVVRQLPADSYNVTVTLAAGAASGTVSYASASLSCSGTLTLTAATGSRLSLSQGIVQGQSDCENGRVTITLTSARSIWFSFRSNGPTAAGKLRRRLAA